MLALPELQRAFLAELLSTEGGRLSGTLEGQIREAGIPTARRLQIYRNNVRENFLATLRATYPVIERLGGADWFVQVAGRYQARYPSRCGDLQYVGQCFPAFLGEELSGTEYGYFSDVARLEWAYQEVLTAGEAPPLDLNRLAVVSPEDYDRLVFVLGPGLRTVASAWPILAIWRANQPAAGEAAAVDTAVDLASGPGRVLVTRQREHGELRECPPGLFALVQALAASRTLGEAAEEVARADPAFELSAGLQRLAGLGVFTDFRAAPYTATEFAVESESVVTAEVP